MPKQRRYGSRKTTTAEGKTEYQKDYMRDYRKHKQSEAIKEANRLAVDISKLLQVKARLTYELKQLTDKLKEMANIIESISSILNRSDLTDKEKVARISAVPIPDDLAAYFRKQFEEVTA